jgi:hypothetical protein
MIIKKKLNSEIKNKIPNENLLIFLKYSNFQKIKFKNGFLQLKDIKIQTNNPQLIQETLNTKNEQSIKFLQLNSSNFNNEKKDKNEKKIENGNENKIENENKSDLKFNSFEDFKKSLMY